MIAPHSTAADRYPLHCVDRGDRVHEDHQFLGPYLTHADAIDACDEPATDLVRRCRQLRPSEIGFDRDVLSLAEYETVGALIDELDEAATTGNLPDGAWYRCGERIVSSKDNASALPTARNFDTWADDHCTLDAFICEGDE